MKKIKVVELFAGVGGFRIGLERASDKYDIVWSNQWEPATRSQEASEIYVKRFGKKNHSNKDIASVEIKEIPEHNLLVGGFPCQDYSVAKSLSQSKGIEGKKGVLWWQIHRILKKKKPELILLENVDRLLKSPSNQRGRDFAIMLAVLSDLGYAVEWRIINAAEYGMPQRRRRVFIIGYHKNSNIYQKMNNYDNEKWALNKGILAESFNVKKDNPEKKNIFQIEGDLLEISNNFNKDGKSSPFDNCGMMIDRKVFTLKVAPVYSGKRIFLRDVLIPEKDIADEFFISKDLLDRWKYLKESKKERRKNKKKDFSYFYTEGSMVFPDRLDLPSRTIVTGEGGKSPSRFKHVIRTKSRKLRRLTPIELERLNMFPDNHTEGCSDIKRAFLMGNALVVGVVERIGISLASKIDF